MLSRLHLISREMAERMPSPRSFLLLGDAYMNIQEVKFMILLYLDLKTKNQKFFFVISITFYGKEFGFFPLHF